MGTSIEFKYLALGYKKNIILQKITGKVKCGSFTAILGPNGAGKSTFLKTIIGILRPLSGKIIFQEGKRGDCAYFPQQIQIRKSFPVTVSDFAAMGLWKQIGICRKIDHGMKKKLEEALDIVGLTALKAEPINILSGGQMQATLLARIILQDAPLILLDEPFSSLDQKNIQTFLSLLKKWHKEGRTILTVLHDINFVRTYIPETLIINHSLVSWGRTEDVLSKYSDINPNPCTFTYHPSILS